MFAFLFNRITNTFQLLNYFFQPQKKLIITTGKTLFETQSLLVSEAKSGFSRSFSCDNGHSSGSNAEIIDKPRDQPIYPALNNDPADASRVSRRPEFQQTGAGDQNLRGFPTRQIIGFPGSPGGFFPMPIIMGPLQSLGESIIDGSRDRHRPSAPPPPPYSTFVEEKCHQNPD